MAHRIAAPYKPRQRQPRVKDTKYLRWVASLPCTVCGLEGSTQAAHLKYSSTYHNKRECGKSERPSDCWVTPLCIQCHEDQHRHNERGWWGSKGIDPIQVCIELREEYENEQKQVR